MQVVTNSSRHPLAAVLSLAISVALGVGGCTLIEPSFATGPATIRRSGHSIEVSICTELTTSGLFVDVRPNGLWSKWVTVLEASGNATVAKGDQFDVRDRAFGLAIDSSAEFDVDNLRDVQLGILAENSSLSQLDASFTVPADGLSSTKWLHTDGTTSVLPCEGE